MEKQQWLVYTLLLEENKYYVGITKKKKKRYRAHLGILKKGAKFTKKYKPLKILETIETKTTNLYEAMVIEDITTHSYMKLYGPKNVKGGTFLGSDRKRYKRFLLFEERGYMSNLTKLYCEFDITYSELEQLGILTFAKSGANSCFVIPTILYAKNHRLNKEFVLQKLIEKSVLCQHPTFNQIQKSN